MFLTGLVLGFGIAAPVGPIGVLCIRRTLAHGQAIGFAGGMGAATGDGLYGLVAALGLTAVTTVLTGSAIWLKLVGGLFLCYLGVTALLARPAERAAETSERGGMLAAYLSTLALTIANPLTILSFVGIFAGLGLAKTTGGDPLAALLLVAGVFVGSALWWLLLSGSVSLLRARFGPVALLWVNRISGTLVLAFGIWALATMTR